MKKYLVDEYQDNSDLQEEFIDLISNDNVFVVGDVKQSIYGFRNANPFKLS
ncbi:MAG: UvrD-helicase domain-containing protein [Erysipelotrichaceae bacterium]